MEQLREAIRNLDPFHCDDLNALCSAFIEEYDADNWVISPIWTLGLIRKMDAFKKERGSWNIPMRVVWGYQEEKPAYKVLRRRWDFQGNRFQKEYHFEFHEGKLETNKWMDAAISGSPGLTGITKPEQAKFHMLYDRRQAEAYLAPRVEVGPWLQPQEAVIKEVKGRMFHTIDLIYVPPTLWVWGIDATQMYIEL